MHEHSVATAFVDDFAALTELNINDGQHIVEAVRAMPTIVSDIMHSRGVCINQSKSGIVITIVGPVSLKTKHLVAEHELIAIHGNKIPAVHRYQHFGGGYR